MDTLFLVLIAGGFLLLVVLLAMLGRSPAAPHPTTLLVCGATGVGKSTLINAIAGRPAAAAGIGSPVTQNTVRIEVPEKNFAFFDSRGLEVGEASLTYLLLLSDLLRLRFSTRANEQIDLVLMCIQEPQGRIDDAHLEIGALCTDLKIPFAVAVTKTEGNQALEAEIRKTFPTARFVLPVRSVELRIGSVVIPPEGLETLQAKLHEMNVASPVEAQRRAAFGMRAAALSDAARTLAAAGGSLDAHWCSFASAAMCLIPLQGKAWSELQREMRDRVRRSFVPNIFRRNFLTRFDYPRIDGAIARRTVPLIVRSFGNRSGRLSETDLTLAAQEAVQLLESDRPYRSRF
ncbi:MAG TPA: GTPase domain-containing protein [Allosphingosinicella sp.]|nr:GTPase domain-containing protein [Allosphingosinicella sp.]